METYLFDKRLWFCPLQLSPPQSPLCIVGRTGEREKEIARGTMGRGKRRSSRLFALPIVPLRAFYFSVIAIFIGIPSETL